MKNKIARQIAGVSAAIHQSSLGSITDNSLLLGNGDINALLYASGHGLKLRLTKNDVWDARVDTASDPALAVIDARKHTVTVSGRLRLINHWSNKLIERETKPGEKLHYTAMSR